jgi:hypothetical protein
MKEYIIMPTISQKIILILAVSFSPALLLPMDPPRLPTSTVDKFQIQCIADREKKACEEKQRLLNETFLSDGFEDKASRKDRFGPFLGNLPNNLLIPLVVGNAPTMHYHLQHINKTFARLFSYQNPHTVVLDALLKSGNPHCIQSIVLSFMQKSGRCTSELQFFQEVRSTYPTIEYKIIGRPTSIVLKANPNVLESFILDIESSDLQEQYTSNIINVCMSRNQSIVQEYLKSFGTQTISENGRLGFSNILKLALRIIIQNDDLALFNLFCCPETKAYNLQGIARDVLFKHSSEFLQLAVFCASKKVVGPLKGYYTNAVRHQKISHYSQKEKDYISIFFNPQNQLQERCIADTFELHYKALREQNNNHIEDFDATVRVLFKKKRLKALENNKKEKQKNLCPIM